MKDIEKNWEIYRELLLSTGRENIEVLIDWLENKSDFKTAPASTQYHLCCKGGLLEHSLNVYYALQDFKDILEYLEIDENTQIITALLHDLCKVNCYEEYYKNVKDKDGNWVQELAYKWEEQEPLGHGAKSVMLINEYGVQLTKVERAMIVNHMGFTECDDIRRVSKLFRICPQSLVLHWADALATFVLEGYDMPKRFIDKKLGKNITESLQRLKENGKIEINGFMYELVNQDSVVDDKSVITVKDESGKEIKVKSPYKDGLPF